jgi:hypothetical protein
VGKDKKGAIALMETIERSRFNNLQPNKPITPKQSLQEMSSFPHSSKTLFYLCQTN